MTTCRWCEGACQPRRGGSPRVFCTSGCRTAFHSACRRWTERAVASGLLSIPELRSGNPAACTLLTSGESSSAAPEAIAALLDAVLAALPDDAWLALPDDVLDRMISAFSGSNK
jgi:hypothetical protein